MPMPQAAALSAMPQHHIPTNLLKVSFLFLCVKLHLSEEGIDIFSVPQSSPEFSKVKIQYPGWTQQHLTWVRGLVPTAPLPSSSLIMVYSTHIRDLSEAGQDKLWPLQPLGE